MLPVKAPHDPAPSRALYRLERLWLTPTIRFFVRVGIPALVLGWLAYGFAADPDTRTAVTAQIQDLRSRIAAHPGLMVEHVVMDDMSAEMSGHVHDAMDFDLPVSRMDLDLEAVHRRILALDAVAEAHVRVEGAGLLKVSVTERVPQLVWRHAEGVELLDHTGARVRSVAGRGARGDLPLIVGPGADQAVGEALTLLELAGPIAKDIRALQRVGARRWTVALTGGVDILLPEEGAVDAMARVMALNGAEDILARDLIAVDMRDARRPILRLSKPALYELRRARGQIGEEDA
ncbi:MAG: cell division protein FtsQ/DivIB [Pseudomonadota bacterium]